MGSPKNYSTKARRIAYSFPRLSFIGIQVNFWILAIFLYSFLTYMSFSYISQLHDINFPLSIQGLIISSLSIGLILGIFLGIVDLLLIKIGIHSLPSGLVILLRTIVYPLAVFLILIFIRFFLLDLMSALIGSDYSNLFENEFTWHYYFWSLLIYIAFMAAVISFINQMNNMFGPGILIPLLMGKYRNPVEEERFFMFLDMKSSVEHAENLGHLEYSALIRDCFIDLNKVLIKNNAEIYQYVGDEAVITWPTDEGKRNMNCLCLFFDFQKELKKKHAYYTSHYGSIPEFKAGLHLGTITAVEVGRIKREIAYHGDTINTAARIQSVCNQYGESFLISKPVKALLSNNNIEYNFPYLGEISLKGKTHTVELFGVEKSSS